MRTENIQFYQGPRCVKTKITQFTTSQGKQRQQNFVSKELYL